MRPGEKYRGTKTLGREQGQTPEAEQGQRTQCLMEGYRSNAGCGSYTGRNAGHTALLLGWVLRAKPRAKAALSLDPKAALSLEP